MNAKILNLALLALLLLPAGGARPQSGEKRPCPEPQEAKDSKFHPGQVWNYKTRPNEQKSTLTILKIEIVTETRGHRPHPRGRYSAP